MNNKARNITSHQYCTDIYEKNTISYRIFPSFNTFWSCMPLRIWYICSKYNGIQSTLWPEKKQNEVHARMISGIANNPEPNVMEIDSMTNKDHIHLSHTDSIRAKVDFHWSYGVFSRGFASVIM